MRCADPNCFAGGGPNHLGKELGLRTGKYVSPNGHVGGRNWISKDLHGPEHGSEHTPYEKGDPTMPEKHSSFFALLTTAAPDPRNAIRNGPEHGSEHAPYEKGDPTITEKALLVFCLP